MNKRYSYDLNCLRNFLISNSNQNIIILNIEEIEKIIKGSYLILHIINQHLIDFGITILIIILPIRHIGLMRVFMHIVI